MTTFKQFLTEQQEYDQAIEHIVIDCKQYINIGGGVDFNLFRGMGEQGLFVEKHSQRDRRPLSTPKVVHQFVDQWFEQKFGFRYRSQGIMTSGNVEHAESYAEVNEGSTYYIFPIGNFSYVWSPVINDLFHGLMELDEKLEQQHGREHTLGIETSGGFPTELDRVQRKEIINMLEQANYTNQNIQQAVQSKSGHEIMIASDYYYALRMDYDQQTVAQSIMERQ